MANWSKNIIKSLLILALTLSSAGLVAGWDSDREGPAGAGQLEK